jgi:ferrous iron transport protein A
MEILMNGNGNEKDRSYEKGGNEPMMPLGLLSQGEKAEVMEVRGMPQASPCCAGNKGEQLCSQICRVEDMGLRTGKVVEMLNNEGRGALLVRLDETRIAIGRGMAMKVMVVKRVNSK